MKEINLGLAAVMVITVITAIIMLTGLKKFYMKIFMAGVGLAGGVLVYYAKGEAAGLLAAFLIMIGFYFVILLIRRLNVFMKIFVVTFGLVAGAVTYLQAGPDFGLLAAFVSIIGFRVFINFADWLTREEGRLFEKKGG